MTVITSSACEANISNATLPSHSLGSRTPQYFFLEKMKKQLKISARIF